MDSREGQRKKGEEQRNVLPSPSPPPPTGPLCEEQCGTLSYQGGDGDVCQAEMASPLLTKLRGLQVSKWRI